ncbi:hypothetical protein SAMN05216602_0752 [Pseudomonas argentinensis]|uniref:Uncharacterized protein n=1 Tax=Phytopseudomonas argentinensis TaxID=289370 RepID=A0A1I3HAT4_9GAMM|nr:hypothetical protein SAMN05216602_0752 [Pseudomonas argentinensis]
MELSQCLRRFLLLICQSRSGQCLNIAPQKNRDS